MIFGVLEEVNMFIVCGGKRNNFYRLKINVGVEKFILGVLYLWKKFFLNFLYNFIFNEYLMENEFELNVNYSLKEEVDDLILNCVSVEGKRNEIRCDEVNIEVLGIIIIVVLEGFLFMESI